MTTMAKCPKCGEFQGILINSLFRHLRDAHGLTVESYVANTGELKLRGWVPGTVEMVEHT